MATFSFPIPDGVVVFLTDLDTPTKVTTTKKYTKKATPKSQNRIGFGGGPKKKVFLTRDKVICQGASS